MWKTEPVRIYSVIAASLALVAHYVPDLPVPLVLGLAAAILGLGEGVRTQVVPSSKIEWVEDDGELVDAVSQFGFQPPGCDCHD